MMKTLYYVAFCIFVVNIGSLLMELIFADEINLLQVEANIGFIGLGIVSMRYLRDLIDYDELSMNTYYLLLAMLSVCGADGSRKIQEKAKSIKFLAQVDPEKFYKEHIEKETK